MAVYHTHNMVDEDVVGTVPRSSRIARSTDGNLVLKRAPSGAVGVMLTVDRTT